MSEEMYTTGPEVDVPQSPLSDAGFREVTRAQVARWVGEEGALREVYPDFDLERESDDPNFMALLQRGAPVRLAYEALHHGALLRAATEQAAARAAAEAAAERERQVVADIRARGTRPAENGASGQSGFVIKRDVSGLTPEEMEDIARRVRAGERISFG